MVKVYWASFLDGLQRVLLFTNDKAVAEKATEVSSIVVCSEQLCSQLCYYVFRLNT